MPGIQKTPRHLLQARPIPQSGEYALAVDCSVMLTLHLLSIWDVEDRRKQKTVIVVKSKERGARTKVMSCAYSPEGNMIGAGGIIYAFSLFYLADLMLQHALMVPYTCGTPPRTLFGQISPLRARTQKALRQVQ